MRTEEESAVGTFLRSGDEAFVLTGGPGDARHIAFKTKITFVHQENATVAFVVIDGGVQFLPENGELVAHSAGRTFYLLPKNDETIQSVRAYTKQQRAEKHARREAKKTYTERLEQARQHVITTEKMLNTERRDLKWVIDRIPNEERRLDQSRRTKAMLEQRIPALEKNLAIAKENLAKVERESPHLGD